MVCKNQNRMQKLKLQAFSSVKADSRPIELWRHYGTIKSAHQTEDYSISTQSQDGIYITVKNKYQFNITLL